MIYESLSCSQQVDRLLDFNRVSEEVALIEGGLLVALLEQRLPRMQTIVLYDIPAENEYPDLMINASTRLHLQGEERSLTQVIYQGYEDYFDEDPCSAVKQLAYFIALTEVLVPEWRQHFDYVSWFKGELGTSNTFFESNGQPLTSQTAQSHDGVIVSLQFSAQCNSTLDLLCPPRQIRWTARIRVNVDRSASQLPLPSCEDSPIAYFIETGKRCPNNYTN